MSAFVETVTLACPYCGECIEMEIDCTAGNHRVIEDCGVCCAPIELTITVDEHGQLLTVEARRDDE